MRFRVKLLFDPDDPFGGQGPQPGPVVEFAVVPTPGMEVPSGGHASLGVRRVRLRPQPDQQGIAADVIVTKL